MSARQHRRDEIMVTAAHMFAVSGFHGVSIDDLGAELGVSGPALYRYFPGKEAILSAMLVDVSERLLAGARERATLPPADRLTALVHFHAEFAVRERDLIAVQYRDLGSVPERERREVRQLQRRYVECWVDALVESYPVSHAHARAVAQSVFGLLNSTPHSGESAELKVLCAMALAALAAGCTFDADGMDQ